MEIIIGLIGVSATWFWVGRYTYKVRNIDYKKRWLTATAILAGDDEPAPNPDKKLKPKDAVTVESHSVDLFYVNNKSLTYPGIQFKVVDRRGNKSIPVTYIVPWNEKNPKGLFLHDADKYDSLARYRRKAEELRDTIASQ